MTKTKVLLRRQPDGGSCLDEDASRRRKFQGRELLAAPGHPTSWRRQGVGVAQISGFAESGSSGFTLPGPGQEPCTGSVTA
jgi:hypothetical protein